MNRTDITRWMTEYDPQNFPGYWHFPFTTADGVEPAVSIDGYGRFGISFTDPAGATREVTGGPLVPGPRAEASAMCGVIAANPEHGTWGQIRRNEAAGAEIHAGLGDELVIFGYVYRIDRAQHRDIRLVLADGRDGLTADEMRIVQVLTRAKKMTALHAWAVIQAARVLRTPAVDARGLPAPDAAAAASTTETD